jgi:phosphoserine / homoserine phosphotransferase
VEIVCLDLEGVLIPEVWIAFANKTGIDSLKATTRDIPDYDVLMTQRLKILNDHGYTLKDIQDVIETLDPMEGAREFVEWLKENFQLIILSDTFYEFSAPFMKKLGWPTIFCHRLEVSDQGTVTDYKLRQKDPKRASVKALHSLNYKVFAAGDSYNDVTMLKEADMGMLFKAPSNVIEEFPQFTSAQEYHELKEAFALASDRNIIV